MAACQSPQPLKLLSTGSEGSDGVASAGLQVFPGGSHSGCRGEAQQQRAQPGPVTEGAGFNAVRLPPWSCDSHVLFPTMLSPQVTSSPGPWGTLSPVIPKLSPSPASSAPDAPADHRTSRPRSLCAWMSDPSAFPAASLPKRWHPCSQQPRPNSEPVWLLLYPTPHISKSSQS